MRPTPETQAELARLVAPIRARLAVLARKERIQRVAAGIGKWLAVMGLVLVLCCLLDEAIDRQGGTPIWLRLFMSFGQVALGLVLGWRWLVRPTREPLTLARLALSVEAVSDGLDHELVTALDYLQGDGVIAHDGLVAEVARRGAKLAESASWEKALPPGRSGKALLRAVGGLAPLIILLIVAPVWMISLLQRQLGLDIDIPRNIQVTLAGPIVLAEGEEGQVTALVRLGQGDPHTEGLVGKLVYRGQDGSRRELSFYEPAHEVFRSNQWVAEIPADLPGGKIQAFFGSARSEKVDLVRLVRPTLTVGSAKVDLPSWVGKRPDGSPWPGTADAGDLGGWVGSTATLCIVSSTPLLSLAFKRISGEGDAQVTEVIPATLNPGDTTAQVNLVLGVGDRLWQAEAVSVDGLSSRNPLRRRVEVWQEIPPQVELLSELMIPDTAGALLLGKNKTTALRQALEEHEVDGVPVPIGGRFRVAYTATSRAGIASARMVYRVNGQDWKSFPLPMVPGTGAEGAFIPELGVFEKTPEEGEVTFHPVKATDPNTSPGGNEAGGRIDFRVAPIQGLRPGDRIEYAIEVTDRHPTGHIGRSPSRVKDAVGLEEFLAWWSRREREQEKLRDLRLRQGAVFEGFFPGSTPSPQKR